MTNEQPSGEVYRYGDEQTMYRNEKGYWIGENGNLYIRKNRLPRLLIKAMVLGFMIGSAFVVFTIVAFGWGGILT